MRSHVLCMAMTEPCVRACVCIGEENYDTYIRRPAVRQCVCVLTASAVIDHRRRVAVEDGGGNDGRSQESYRGQQCVPHSSICQSTRIRCRRTHVDPVPGSAGGGVREGRRRCMETWRAPLDGWQMPAWPRTRSIASWSLAWQSSGVPRTDLVCYLLTAAVC